jgi:hypothetical protein
MSDEKKYLHETNNIKVTGREEDGTERETDWENYGADRRYVERIRRNVGGGES